MVSVSPTSPLRPVTMISDVHPSYANCTSRCRRDNRISVHSSKASSETPSRRRSRWAAAASVARWSSYVPAAPRTGRADSADGDPQPDRARPRCRASRRRRRASIRATGSAAGCNGNETCDDAVEDGRRPDVCIDAFIMARTGPDYCVYETACCVQSSNGEGGKGPDDQEAHQPSR